MWYYSIEGIMDDKDQELLNKDDFNVIKEQAIQLYKDLNFPKKFKDRLGEIDSSEAPNFCIMLSTLNYLQGKNCLSKEVKFDLKDNDVK